MSLQFENPVQPVLEMPKDDAAWQRSAAIADPEVRWRIYLQQIGQGALLAWFQEEFDLPVRAWPQDTPMDVWHVVDGLALTLGNRRIVVMLDEAIDAAELRVPQEWVDIPAWQASYYIAAYIDVDRQQLVPWGYTTHAHLKTAGTYDAHHRTYSLNDEDLIQDFSVFWVAQQVERGEPLPVAELPEPLPRRADQLIQQLAQAQAPRLVLPFVQWGALLQRDRWRNLLYQQRQGILPVDLGLWAHQIFAQGWQTLDSLLRPQSLALAFRSGHSNNNVAVRGKALQLHTSTASYEFVLALTVLTAAADRRHIRIQLHPAAADVLPQDVSLTLELPDADEPLQQVRSRECDNYIQLPPFRCPAGQPFSVGIYCTDTAVHERFVT